VRNWKEESEIEKYKEIRTLLESLEIPTQFAALGASNAFQFQGTLPEDKETITAALDKIIETVKEDDLRESSLCGIYRHLWRIFWPVSALAAISADLI